MEYQCIIVLANEMDKDGNLNKESLSRAELAVDFYFSNTSTYLITSGWDYRKDSSIYIGNVMKDYSIKLGVPTEKIITELNSRDTVGDAFFIKQNVIINRGWKNILVVTSDYHVKRASRIFKFIFGPKYNIKVIGSEGFENHENQFSEKRSLESFEKTFQNIKDGDDIRIYKQLSTQHPFYNDEIYSKVYMTIKR